MPKPNTSKHPDTRKKNPNNGAARQSKSAFPLTTAETAADYETIDIDEKVAVDLAMRFMAIPGGSGDEVAVASQICSQLVAAGALESWIRFDDAHERALIRGNVGNLIVQLPGTVKAPRRLLMAHMDTVPVCIGTTPVRKGDRVVSGNPATGLGADDRAGVAVVVHAATTILRRGLPHPPLTLLFPIQEEVGLHGARNLRTALLGKPKLAFNWDGGASEKLSVGATGGYRMTIRVQGQTSHAGNAPELGVSAISIASLAIAELVQMGWHGAIRKGAKLGTSNVGVIQGGAATNVVTDRVELRAEARSHDPAFRAKIVKAFERAFSRAAKQIRSSDGRRGSVAIEGRLDYESFRLLDDDPSLLAAERAIRAVGAKPMRAISNGGLDANWMTAHGIPTVTMGCGQLNVHTQGEQLDIPAYLQACRIALLLAQGC